MSKKQLIWLTGAWLLPVCMLIDICMFIFVKESGFRIFLFFLSLVPVIILFAWNLYQHYRFGFEDFDLKSIIDRNKDNLTQEKLCAVYTPPREKYLYKKPTGLVLAKTRSKYVCVPVEKKAIYNMVLIGQPGSGKSAGAYLCTLASNFAQQNPVPCFVIDIKGELHTGSVHDDDPHVRIIDPTDPDSWGWDPFYCITQSSSDDEVKLILEQIATTLILEYSEKNKFFSNSARAMFVGIELYYWRKIVWTGEDNTLKSGFSDAMQELISRDPVELINSILSDEEICKKHPLIRAQIGRFLNAESEALNGIKLSLTENLSVFSMEIVQKMLSVHNTKRSSPLDLNAGYSIFLAIPEHMLSTLATVFRMITYQTLTEMEKRPPSAPATMMLIDEFPRLGRLGKSQGTEVSGIFSALSTLRSRGVAIAPISMQDLSQIRSIYSREEAAQIFALSQVICLLGTQDLETAKMLSEQSGYYEQTKKSINRHIFSGFLNNTETVSTERRSVVDVADLMRLREEGGVAMWIEGRYCRAKRIRWYEEPYLKKIVEENMEYNKKLRQRKEELRKQQQDSANEEILFFDEQYMDYADDISGERIDGLIEMLMNEEEE